MKFTDLEKRVLLALIEGSEDSGHDFVCTEEARFRGAVDSPRQLSGVIASLIKKEIISHPYPQKNDTGTFHYFEWVGKYWDDEEGRANAEELNKLKALLEGGAA